VSKYQHFFLYALMLTLLVGCELIPQKSAEPSSNENNACLCNEEQRLKLQQNNQVLKTELGVAKKQIHQLEAERDLLKAKLDALTAIERSLHERKQRQSN